MFWKILEFLSFHIDHQVKCTTETQLFLMVAGCERRVVSNQSAKQEVAASGARGVGRAAATSSLLHSLMVTGHVARRCSAVSCSLRHKTQAALWGQPFFCRQSAV